MLRIVTLPGGTGVWLREPKLEAEPTMSWREFASHAALIVFFVIAIFAALALRTGGFAP